jgi:hypothetical protein
MEEKQKFQSDFQLTLLKAHAMWTSMEDFFLAPLRKLVESLGPTHIFRE